MGKLTKKDRIKVLEWQVKTLIQSMTNIEEWSSCADNMLTELNHALPDPEYDAKREAQEADIDASLDRHRERLCLNKPQLKQLDQSVFNGLDEKWRFAAVDLDGESWVYREQPKIDKGDDRWSASNTPPNSIGTGYDTTDWQNSLIERDTAKELLEVDLSSELTGSELCKAMLARGDKYVMCGVSDVDDSDAANHESDDFLAEAVTDFDCKDELFGTTSMRWNYAVPINNQGEPLTASEFGL